MVVHVTSWDQDAQGGTWDSGLQWDVGTFETTGDVAQWTALITSEHNQRPIYIETLTEILQPLADLIVNMAAMPADFDLDTAVGAQLDAVGVRVGVGRQISIPLVGVYFALDTADVGFDQGTWFGPFDNPDGVFVLPDDAYRALIRARIADNQWDGTISGAYAIYDAIFAETGFSILIQDLGNMHMIFAIAPSSTTPDAVTLALFTGGYLSIKPAGVMIDGYMSPSVPNTPYFGFDVQTSAIDGLDVGAWGVLS